MKRVNLPHKHGYPGDGYYYVLCDVCGVKMRAKDAIFINDKYNLFNQLLVCPADADETNPQSYIKSVRERQIDDPNLIRSQYNYRVSALNGNGTSDPSKEASITTS